MQGFPAGGSQPRRGEWRCARNFFLRLQPVMGWGLALCVAFSVALCVAFTGAFSVALCVGFSVALCVAFIGFVGFVV